MKIEEMSVDELIKLCLDSALYDDWALRNGYSHLQQNVCAIELLRRFREKDEKIKKLVAGDDFWKLWFEHYKLRTEIAEEELIKSEETAV